MAAAVVHGLLRAWRLLLLPAIIGEREPALSTLVWYQLLFSALSSFETALVKLAADLPPTSAAWAALLPL